MLVRAYGRTCSCVCIVPLILLSALARGQSAGTNDPNIGRDLPHAISAAPSDYVAPSVAPRISSPGTIPPRLIGPAVPWHPPTTPLGTYGLAQLSAAAGTIFSGTVTAIALKPASSSSTASSAIQTVAITFHVEQAIRGVTPGDDFTLTQWIGAWSSGQRYRVGDRLLLFLYPASKLGLTSCVGGNFGRFAIDPWGMVRFSAQHVAAFRADPLVGGKSRVSFHSFAAAVQHVQAGSQEAE
jgi:hypothetical protein